MIVRIHNYLNSFIMKNTHSLIWFCIVCLSFIHGDIVSAFTPSEEQAIIDSVRQTSPWVTTTMSPWNAVIATMAEREWLIQKNVSLWMSYADASAKVDSYYAWWSNGPKKIVVTEEIPGGTCICITEDNCIKPETRKYECTLEWTGLTSFQKLIAAITKWFVYLTMLFWVLALVWAWILWAWGSESEEYTKKAKGWAVNIIIWLALLFTFRYILGFLAPWVFM